MVKKLICFGLLLAMFFSFAACTPQKKGDFYTLQEAYDQGLLTIDDLKNIAYYQNGESPDENFVPSAKNPEILSAETESAIKETLAYDYRNDTINPQSDAKAEDNKVLSYLGTYNNCIAVVTANIHLAYPCVAWEEEVEGVIFKYGIRIYIFKAI